MPNHVTNRLTVSGEPEKVKAFFAAIDGGVDDENKPLLIDFNKIKPMPEVLNIDDSTITRGSLQLYEAFRQESSFYLQSGDITPELLERYAEHRSIKIEALKLGEQLYNNKQTYGAVSWYDWRVQNWGTKWPAYGQSRVDENTIEFLTAWAGATRIMERLSEQFPDIKMSYMYADEDWGVNVGEYEYEGGECVYEHRPPGDSEEANRIAEELLGPRENEDESEFEDDDEWEDEI